MAARAEGGAATGAGVVALRFRGGDTIAAIATPAAAGGIGVVRVSGPEAVGIAARVLGRDPGTLEDRRVAHGWARDPDSGERLDEVLCLVMRAPRSFTGEDVAELHGHGGVVNMRRLLAAVLKAGARPAEPGEFTRRAFESGRLDLTRAEAILGVIEAASEQALRVAQAQLAGRLGERVGALRRGATELLAQLEASIDFPEEGIDVAARSALGAQAEGVAAGCRALADTFASGRALREGISVALCGEVNAGKSSLFNALVGRERALVSDEPGTTRDFVEADVVWDGVRVTLIDTAGRREATTVLEGRGIELGEARAREADLEVWLVPAASLRDGRAGGRGVVAGSAGGRSRLVAASKGDEVGSEKLAGLDLLVTSARTGAGLDALRGAVLERAAGGAGSREDQVVLSSERQQRLVSQAAVALSRAANAGEARQAEELMAADVREAADALAQVLGERVGDEVLDALFARFCIGK